jgi:hypothetical protein
MKDANIAGTASSVWPREPAGMSAGVKRLGSFADRDPVDGSWVGNNLESLASCLESREKAFADRTTVADIGHHHLLPS